jgi:HK97 family phage major capsid protein
MGNKYDFSGWATRNDIKCSDGRTIRKNAFIGNDGKTVPLVWNHQHDEATNVLGHALLENREEGVYAYGTFNNTVPGQHAKEMVRDGDITGLSIYANHLKQSSKGDVYHGEIRELSLVLAGANPGAYIENIGDAMAHSENDEFEAHIYFSEDEQDITLTHADEEDEKETKVAEGKNNKSEEKTIKDVFDSLTEEQKTAVYYVIGEATKGKGQSKENEEDDTEENEGREMKHSDEGDNFMKYNIFDNEERQEDTNMVLSHSDMQSLAKATMRDLKKYGTLKESLLANIGNFLPTSMQHADGDYGIADIEMLFPDARTIETTPEFIQRQDAWVTSVINGTRHTPFTRVKSVFADITADEARAKGYTKGKKKIEEVITLLRRTTDPQTIYKKQKLDRDDILDITDFDVVAWLRGEMRIMLNEELGRAILIGDGRSAVAEDKIKEDHIRPVWTDDKLYTIKAPLAGLTSANTEDEIAKAFIRKAIKSRKDYRGSGNPTLFTTEDMLTDMLLLEDKDGRVIYDTEEKLRTALRVSKIVTVPVMENQTRTDADDTKKYDLLGIIVNLSDYNVGSDKGGSVSMFDDFDIDYNQYKYLMETRVSGALIKPYSAIVLEVEHNDTAAAG